MSVKRGAYGYEVTFVLEAEDCDVIAAALGTDAAAHEWREAARQIRRLESEDELAAEFL